MNEKQSKFWKELAPYEGIIYFLFLLFLFHCSWKIAIDGDMDSDFIYLFDKNITPDWFHTACKWLANAAAWFVHLFPGGKDVIVDNTLVYFPDGGIKISIIWGCTGIKQMFIFSAIMIFYRCISFKRNETGKLAVQFNPYWKKLWYIPMGCVILTIYNVIRIGSTVLLTKGHPERFDSLHDGIFRYIYYGLIFLLWVTWEEVYVKKQIENEHQKTSALTS